MDVACIISQENPDLAIGEIEELFKARALRMRNDAVRASVNEPQLLARLAFTKIASEIIVSAPEQDFPAALSSAHDRLSRLQGTYRITIHGHGKTTRGEREFAAMLALHIPLMRADIKNPSVVLDIIPADVLYLCVRTYTNTEDWNSRKAHRRAVLHPSGMHPKLARGLVNLSGAKREILDPLCGVGGILLEAGLMGLHARGSDIDAKLLAGARKNLDAFNVIHATLEQKDALTLGRAGAHAEAIVTDFPYGRHSRAPKELEQFYLQALRSFSALTSRCVIMLPDDVDADAILRKTSWKIQRRYSWYAHKSLTRMIYVLDAS